VLTGECGGAYIYFWEAAKVLLPVLPAFLAGYLVNRWKSREDAIDKRCDEMRRELSEASRLGQSYWIKNQIDLEDELIPAKIQAAQRKLSEMRVRLDVFLSVESSKSIIAAEQQFQRAVTGGNFGVHNRLADTERARNIIYRAAEYDVAIRMSRLNDMKGIRRT
jgi:hypothetical protein